MWCLFGDAGILAELESEDVGVLARDIATYSLAADYRTAERRRAVSPQVPPSRTLRRRRYGTPTTGRYAILLAWCARTFTAGVQAMVIEFGIQL
jgi:hypothetical protein